MSVLRMDKWSEEKVMGKRHLRPDEIKAQLNAIAREKRMADRSPWSAMSIICPYVIMKCEGFKGQRILRIINKIKEMEEQWSKGELELEAVSQRLKDKADWTIEYKQWTEADITAKKGSYKYWLDKVQLEPQNRINQHAGRYMLFFFVSLMDEYGFGKERLTRVEEYMNQLILDYQQDKTTVREWKKVLYEEAGVIIEMPIDPLTQTQGSIMTG